MYLAYDSQESESHKDRFPILDKGIAHDFHGNCLSPFSRYFKCEHTGRIHRVTLGCHSRWDDVCPVCASKWRKMMRNRYHKGVLAMVTPKFITLTLKRNDIVGDDGSYGLHSLDDLWRLRNQFFHILRKRTNSHTGKLYKIRSWVACIEPPNHIHMIVDCEFIPQHEMSEIWHTITGDSIIVDIRPVHSKSQCSGYVTKYITKTKDWPLMEPSERKHLRICQSDGLPKDDYQKQSICPCGQLHCLHPTYTSEYYDTIEYEEWEKK
jgi:hypothetical protein